MLFPAKPRPVSFTITRIVLLGKVLSSLGQEPARGLGVLSIQPGVPASSGKARRLPQVSATYSSLPRVQELWPTCSSFLQSARGLGAFICPSANPGVVLWSGVLCVVFKECSVFCARSALCCVQECSVSRESAQCFRGRSSVSGLSRPVQDWPGHPRCSTVFSRTFQGQAGPGGPRTVPATPGSEEGQEAFSCCPGNCEVGPRALSP